MGKLCREKPTDETIWLKARAERGIGGSEAAAIVGMSPWMTANELWQLKTGNAEPKDLSDDSFVQKGVRLEPALRELYKAIHPDTKVSFHKYDLLFQSDRPWLFATLDGELKEGKRKGVLEIKTSTPVGKAGWEKWNNQIPSNYHCQILHQFLATGYDFAVLFACLFNAEGDFTVREYRFEREDLKDDLNWLLEKETEFWQTVQNRTLPPMTLVL